MVGSAIMCEGYASRDEAFEDRFTARQLYVSVTKGVRSEFNSGFCYTRCLLRFGVVVLTIAKGSRVSVSLYTRRTSSAFQIRKLIVFVNASYSLSFDSGFRRFIDIRVLFFDGYFSFQNRGPLADYVRLNYMISRIILPPFMCIGCVVLASTGRKRHAQRGLQFRTCR